MQLESNALQGRDPSLLALSSRFYPKVNRDGPIPEWHPEYGDCHDWTAVVGSNGYGQIGGGKGRKRAMGAHRAAWELASGMPVPDGMMVGHTCDRALCVRNDTAGVYVVNGREFPRFGHLWLGTLQDNNEDMFAKGRAFWQMYPEHPRQTLNRRRGEEHARAMLMDDQVREIRRLYALGGVYQRDLAKQFGVSVMTVNYIVRGMTWRHLL
jgi:hypothetical protein